MGYEGRISSFLPQAVLAIISTLATAVVFESKFKGKTWMSVIYSIAVMYKIIIIDFGQYTM